MNCPKPSVAKKIPRVAHDGGRIVTNKYETLLAFFQKKGKSLADLNPQERAALAAAQSTTSNCQIMSTSEAEARSCAAGLARGGTAYSRREKENDPEEVQPSLSKLQKKLQKKLHQIEALERAQMSGQTLEKTQLEKVAKKAELWREFEAASSCH